MDNKEDEEECQDANKDEKVESVSGSKKRKGDERTPGTPKKHKTDQDVEDGSSKVEEEQEESKVRI